MKKFFSLILIFLFAGCAAFSADWTVRNHDESKVPVYMLPDVLVTEGGERVKDKDKWINERRPEVLELFREHVYGRSPGRPENMTFETIFEDDGLYGGLATRRSVRVCFTERAGGPCMVMHIFIPNGAKKPVPVFVGVLIIKEFEKTQDYPMPSYLLEEQIGGMWKYAQADMKDTRPAKPVGKLPGRKLPGVILKRGYAFASIAPESLAPDDPKTYDTEIIREYSDPDRSKRPGSDWETIGAWAWGLSRAVDYFETDDDIDQNSVIVLGHSRRGKTALWAGAQDERFRIVISNNSGCTGAALSRRRFGETVRMINTSFPHWFCENYNKYNDNENALPIDQHMLVSLIAPRPVYIASADKDFGADPQGEFLSALNAGPVYELFGQKGVGVTQMPMLNEPVGDYVGYHIRSGGHALTDYDWLRYLDFADRHLKDK
ncbi:MAG TPA: acetylxylan esterase [bacterium]|nr:acetylxylan esterase [bacterium]